MYQQSQKLLYKSTEIKKNNCLSTEIHEKSYFFLVLHEVTAFNTSYQ